MIAFKLMGISIGNNEISCDLKWVKRVSTEATSDYINRFNDNQPISVVTSDPRLSNTHLSQPIPSGNCST